jgi:hypothetical protein
VWHHECSRLKEGRLPGPLDVRFRLVCNDEWKAVIEKEEKARDEIRRLAVWVSMAVARENMEQSTQDLGSQGACAKKPDKRPTTTWPHGRKAYKGSGNAELRRNFGRTCIKNGCVLWNSDKNVRCCWIILQTNSSESTGVASTAGATAGRTTDGASAATRAGGASAKGIDIKGT